MLLKALIFAIISATVAFPTHPAKDLRELNNDDNINYLPTRAYPELYKDYSNIVDVLYRTVTLVENFHSPVSEVPLDSAFELATTAIKVFTAVLENEAPNSVSESNSQLIGSLTRTSPINASFFTAILRLSLLFDRVNGLEYRRHLHDETLPLLRQVVGEMRKQFFRVVHHSWKRRIDHVLDEILGTLLSIQNGLNLSQP